MVASADDIIELQREPTRAPEAEPPSEEAVPSVRNWQPWLAAGLIVLASLAVSLGWRWLMSDSAFPLTAVRLEGSVQRVQEAELRKALIPEVRGGMLSLDLSAIRTAVEALPWVDVATVRRDWPGTLVLEIVEQQASAIWGDKMLINERGEPFAPVSERAPDGLAVLRGPEHSRHKVLEQYRRLVAALEPTGLEVTELTLGERKAWYAVLDEEIRVRLTGNDEKAIRRFVRAYPELMAGEQRRLRGVDLRYPNGFALTWDEPGAAAGRGQR